MNEVLAPARRVRRHWAAWEVEALRKLFADSRTDDLARALGRSYTTVAQKAGALGLRKSAAYLASPEAHRLDGKKGLGTRFQAGQKAWNKGLHYQPGGRVKESQFKPGVLCGRAAQLAAPVGSYRVNADGYLDQKISDRSGPQTLRWRAVHRLVWEAAHGSVPPGCAVCFKPGRHSTDPDYITEDALELVARADLMRRNSVHAKYPPELARVAQLRGVLTRQINRRAREGDQA